MPPPMPPIPPPPAGIRRGLLRDLSHERLRRQQQARDTRRVLQCAPGHLRRVHPPRCNEVLELLVPGVVADVPLGVAHPLHDHNVLSTISSIIGLYVELIICSLYACL